MGHATPPLPGVVLPSPTNSSPDAKPPCKEAETERRGGFLHRFRAELLDDWSDVLAEKQSIESSPEEKHASAPETPALVEAQEADLLRRQPAFRAKYLGRLTAARVLEPRRARPPCHQTVTIFDWDDTLLCTSFLSANRRAVGIGAALIAVGAIARQLLTIALQSGRAFIITNAVEGWVQHSAKKFLPDLCDVLDKVPVISARSRFESQFPDNMWEWKTQAFLQVQKELDEGAVANLISLGDSELEMEAAQEMARKSSRAVVKTVKFWDRPSPDDLRRQLELVLKDFRRIIDHPSDAKIGFQRRNQQSSPEF